ncbi:hypothetical protein BDN71DRAFT_1374491, partial [Pleurotus eryngii]
LFLIDKILHQSNHLLSEFHSMLQWSQDWENTVDNPLIAEQLDYNQDIECDNAKTWIQQLNHDQWVAFDSIMESVLENHRWTFFLDGPGETGKTFIYNTL